MASDAEFLSYALGQLRNVPRVTHRRMFGEYAIYVNEKVVAFICDNQFFLKPNDAAREMLGTPVEAPAYPGSKMYYLVDEHLDDPDFFTALLRATATAMPEPRPKAKARARPDAKPRP